MEDNRLERIEQKVDKIDETLQTVNIVLAKQHVVLEEHVRRTNLLEQELKPVKLHVDRVEGVVKFLGLVGVLAAIIEGTVAFLSYVGK